MEEFEHEQIKTWDENKYSNGCNIGLLEENRNQVAAQDIMSLLVITTRWGWVLVYIAYCKKFCTLIWFTPGVFFTPSLFYGLLHYISHNFNIGSWLTSIRQLWEMLEEYRESMRKLNRLSFLWYLFIVDINMWYIVSRHSYINMWYIVSRHSYINMWYIVSRHYI